MDERNDIETVDEVMMPGFRFHPTDEELVGFYLKRKIQQKTLSIELIRQLDIYKYDPWDLPKLATTGEKEWYFYCPRDRKYRNSARPNRVTGAGFWKATGTDRPIYSSEAIKCIGLKKSLVFYKGRAARGVKTDWMMHEFRLPSLTDSSLPKRSLDRNIPANDSWAICRIFKRTNSTAKRALSQSWASPVPEPAEADIVSVCETMNANQFSSETIPCTAEAASSIQFSCPPLDPTTYINNNNNSMGYFRSYPLPVPISDTFTSFSFSASEMMPVASMLLNLSSPSIPGEVGRSSASLDFGQPQQCNGFTDDLSSTETKKSLNTIDVSFPFSLPPNISEEWKLNLPWEYPPLCLSETPTSFAMNKCYS